MGMDRFLHLRSIVIQASSRCISVAPLTHPSFHRLKKKLVDLSFVDLFIKRFG
jgi:hypothetical protein